MPSEEPLDDSDRRLLSDIEEHGWHAIIIDDDEPSAYVFSVGFMHTLGHPELVMFGLDPELMHAVLWNAFRDIQAARRIDANGLYEDLIEGYAIAAREVHESWHPRYLGYAQWHRRYLGKRGTLRAMQIVWPDKAGLFPWENGCHPSVVELQPRLDLLRPTSPHE